MSETNVSPFGNYGVCITDIRESKVCRADMTKIKNAEYLFQRGCSFDLYKWNDDKGYEKVLQYDGKDFNKVHNSKGNPLFPAHMWFNELDDLQKWMGVYYEAAIACMIASETKKQSASDVEEALNELFKKQYPTYPYKKTTPNDEWYEDNTIIPWKDNTWTTSYNNKIEEMSKTLDGITEKVKQWKPVK